MQSHNLSQNGDPSWLGDYTYGCVLWVWNPVFVLPWSVDIVPYWSVLYRDLAITHIKLTINTLYMVTSWHEQTFHIAGHLCMESTCFRYYPNTKTSSKSFVGFFVVGLNEPLNKQSRGRGNDSPQHSCHAILMKRHAMPRNYMRSSDKHSGPCYSNWRIVRYRALRFRVILGLHPANKRRRYFVTTSLIGWAQA